MYKIAAEFFQNTVAGYSSICLLENRLQTAQKTIYYHLFSYPSPNLTSK